MRVLEEDKTITETPKILRVEYAKILNVWTLLSFKLCWIFRLSNEISYFSVAQRVNWASFSSFGLEKRVNNQPNGVRSIKYTINVTAHILREFIGRGYQKYSWGLRPQTHELSPCKWPSPTPMLNPSLRKWHLIATLWPVLKWYQTVKELSLGSLGNEQRHF